MLLKVKDNNLGEVLINTKLIYMIRDNRIYLSERWSLIVRDIDLVNIKKAMKETA